MNDNIVSDFYGYYWCFVEKDEGGIFLYRFLDEPLNYMDNIPIFDGAYTYVDLYDNVAIIKNKNKTIVADIKENYTVSFDSEKYLGTFNNYFAIKCVDGSIEKYHIFKI